MDAYISEEIIEEIRERSDIVETISGFVSLKKTGRNYKGLCPFHSEKTPSFIVSPEKQIFHCFGCGRGGNVFQFLMLYEDFSFPESVKFLASKIGVDIPDKKIIRKTSFEVSEDKDKLFQINNLASRYFHKLLKESPIAEKARLYLKKRGINEISINEFQLGYSIPSWDHLLKYSKTNGISETLLEKTGLIIKRSHKEGYYDRFRDRIIFPIFNMRDNIIGFGGRSLDNSDSAKYINSPESIVFQKGKNLFGLNLSKDSIKSEEAVLITEGYFDVITAHQNGIKNVVATLGTSITKDHVYKLKRYTKNLYLVFDSDKAGESAVKRVEELFTGDRLRIYVVSLPAGYDLDSYIREESKSLFSKRIKSALPLVKYIINITLKNKDLNKIEEKIDCIDKLMPTISRLKSSIEQNHYISLLADRMNLSSKELMNEFQKGNSIHKRISLNSKEKERMPTLETEIGRLFLANTTYLYKKLDKIREIIPPSEIGDEKLSKIIFSVYKIYDENKKLTVNNIIDQLPVELSGLARKMALEGELLYGNGKEKIWDQALDDCIKKFMKKNKKAQIKKINTKMKEAEQKGEIKEINELQRRLMIIYKNSSK